MKCREILEQIEKEFPTSAALSFDNVGLQVGNRNKEVQSVYVALDATSDVIEQAIEWKADLLITHHPLIFSPLKQVTDEDFVSARVLKLAQNDITYYAMHTNYDVLGMAELAESILEIEDADVLDETEVRDEKPVGIGRIGQLKTTMQLEECCAYVKEKLKLENVKVFGDRKKEVQRIAVSPGSGKSVISSAVAKGADVLVTGDIGHHEGLDALEQGLAVIDAGHYGTEYIFMEDMKHFLQGKFPMLQVTCAPIASPFWIE